MLNFIFCKKSIVSLTTVLRANRALSRGRRVLRTQKNPKVSRLGRLVNFLPHSVVDHAQLIRIERDPQRSVFLGLFRFLRSGFLSYMLLPFVKTAEKETEGRPPDVLPSPPPCG